MEPRCLSKDLLGPSRLATLNRCPPRLSGHFKRRHAQSNQEGNSARLHCLYFGHTYKGGLASPLRKRSIQAKRTRKEIPVPCECLRFQLGRCRSCCLGLHGLCLLR
jgi:hypothetical protein